MAGFDITTARWGPTPQPDDPVEDVVKDDTIYHVVASGESLDELLTRYSVDRKLGYSAVEDARGRPVFDRTDSHHLYANEVVRIRGGLPAHAYRVTGTEQIIDIVNEKSGGHQAAFRLANRHLIGAKTRQVSEPALLYVRSIDLGASAKPATPAAATKPAATESPQAAAQTPSLDSIAQELDALIQTAAPHDGRGGRKLLQDIGVWMSAKLDGGSVEVAHAVLDAFKAKFDAAWTTDMGRGADGASQLYVALSRAVEMTDEKGGQRAHEFAEWILQNKSNGLLTEQFSTIATGAKRSTSEGVGLSFTIAISQVLAKRLPSHPWREHLLNQVSDGARQAQREARFARERLQLYTSHFVVLEQHADPADTMRVLRQRDPVAARWIDQSIDHLDRLALPLWRLSSLPLLQPIPAPGMRTPAEQELAGMLKAVSRDTHWIEEAGRSARVLAAAERDTSNRIPVPDGAWERSSQWAFMIRDGKNLLELGLQIQMRSLQSSLLAGNALDVEKTLRQLQPMLHLPYKVPAADVDRVIALTKQQIQSQREYQSGRLSQDAFFKRSDQFLEQTNELGLRSLSLGWRQAMMALNIVTRSVNVLGGAQKVAEGRDSPISNQLIAANSGLLAAEVATFRGQQRETALMKDPSLKGRPAFALEGKLINAITRTGSLVGIVLYTYAAAQISSEMGDADEPEKAALLAAISAGAATGLIGMFGGPAASDLLATFLNSGGTVFFIGASIADTANQAQIHDAAQDPQLLEMVRQTGFTREQTIELLKYSRAGLSPMMLLDAYASVHHRSHAEQLDDLKRRSPAELSHLVRLANQVLDEGLPLFKANPGRDIVEILALPLPGSMRYTSSYQRLDQLLRFSHAKPLVQAGPMTSSR